MIPLNYPNKRKYHQTKTIKENRKTIFHILNCQKKRYENTKKIDLIWYLKFSFGKKKKKISNKKKKKKKEMHVGFVRKPPQAFLHIIVKKIIFHKKNSRFFSQTFIWDSENLVNWQFTRKFSFSFLCDLDELFLWVSNVVRSWVVLFVFSQGDYWTVYFRFMIYINCGFY